MEPDSGTLGKKETAAPPAADLTDLLHAWRTGDGPSGDRLFEALYRELRAIASRQVRRERAGATLTTTALVNEAYVRLIDQRRTVWADRRHFLAIAATTMRRVLVDRARARLSQRRGGQEMLVTLSGLEDVLAAPSAEVLDVDRALARLAEVYPRQAKVVELRFFGGLEEREIADLVGIAERTVRRDWSFAAAWLARELGSMPA